jgi:hypothetical protein
MDTRDIPSGAVGDVDTRDTHTAPGEQKRPYPPVQPPGDAIYGGATPTLPDQPSGAGGTIEGDVRLRSDGYEVSPPERRDVDEPVHEDAPNVRERFPQDIDGTERDA